MAADKINVPTPNSSADLPDDDHCHWSFLRGVKRGTFCGKSIANSIPRHLVGHYNPPIGREIFCYECAKKQVDVLDTIYNHKYPGRLPPT